jgi:hypothetical protein
MTQNVLPVLLQPLRGGRLVDAINRGAAQLHQTPGDGLVGEQHELFNQLV